MYKWKCPKCGHIGKSKNDPETHLGMCCKCILQSEVSIIRKIENNEAETTEEKILKGLGLE